MGTEFKQGIVKTKNVEFHTLEAGSGPLVLCLHGFPDTAHSFGNQMPALADGGFRAVAPFMRGYAPSGQPADGRYDSVALAEDVIALIDALEYQDAMLFGHDWGAVAAYGAAASAPHRIRKLVAAAVPYGPQFFAAMLGNYAQQKRSWYMFFFQQPLADLAVRHNDFAYLEGLWRDWSPGWRWSADELAALKECFRVTGTLEAALGYYRHSLGPAFGAQTRASGGGALTSSPIEVPSMMIHGRDDGCIGAELLDGMAAYFPKGLRIEIVPNAGHFVHRERPAEVNRLMVEFLKA